MSAADPIWAISWSPDGRRLVSGDSTGAGAVWDVKTGRRMLSIKEMHNGKVGGVVWGDNGGTNPTGKFFVTGGDDGLVSMACFIETCYC